MNRPLQARILRLVYFEEATGPLLVDAIAAWRLENEDAVVEQIHYYQPVNPAEAFVWAAMLEFSV